MPLRLTNLDTGQQSPPMTRPKAVVSGRGDDRLGAVLAPLPPGWLVVPVGGANVQVNGSRLARPAVLRFGQQLVLGAKRFFVDQCTTMGPADGPAPVYGRDEAELTGRCRGWSGQVKGPGPLVVGTAPDCDLVVPAAAGLDRHHAVLVRADDRWHLFVLGRRGATTLTDPTPAWAVAVASGPSMWLGDVEITTKYEPMDPLDRVYGAEPSSVAPVGETVNDRGPAVPTEPTEVPALPTPDPRPVGRPVPDRLTVEAANALCRRLQESHKRVLPQAAPARLAGPPLTPTPTPRAGTAGALERFDQLLAADPWCPDRLFALATHLWEVGLAEQARWVLKQLHQQCRADPVATESVGVVCWAMAQDPARDTAVRLDDLDRAYRYLTRAAQQAPTDARVAELARAVGAELSKKRSQWAETR